MKNKFVVLSICLIAIGSIAIAMANQNSDIKTSNPSTANTPITKEHASNIAAKLLPIDEAKTDLLSDNQKSYWGFAYIEGINATFVDIDANTGQVIGYFNSSKTGNKISVTADKALIMTKTQLTEYGIDLNSLDVLQPSIQLLEYPHEKMYSIIWAQQKNGVPIYGSFVSARVNPDTGELISFVKEIADDMSIANIDTTPNINRDNAIKSASEFLNKSYGLPLDSKPLSSTIEIRKPNDWANTRDITPTGSYTLTWIVTFEDKTRDDGHLVQGWVDAHTGDIIGGESCK